MWMDVDINLASVPVNILALIDDTTFKDIEDAVVFNQAGLALFWHFSTTLGVTTVTAVTPTAAGDYDWTDFTTSGFYGIEIPASGGASINNDTKGFGFFSGVATGILPWRGPIIGFRLASINDALVDSDTLLNSFDIGLLLKGAITTVTTQLEFITDAAIAVNNSWIGHVVSLEDDSSGQVYASNNGQGIWVSDIIAASNSIVISSVFPITVVTSDTLRIHVEQHPQYVIDTYDPPTRTEASADKDAILSKLPTALTIGGRIKTAVEVVNGRIVIGTGGAAPNQWGDGGAET